MEIGRALSAMPQKQRAAARYLAGFFALMALLTFLSRAADSFTVPVVTVERISGGSLEHKVVAEGSLYPVSQTAVFAPAGYRILGLHVEQGWRVAAGDRLAELDVAQMQEQLDAARAELQKLRLAAAANAVEVPEETDRSGIDAAQRNLDRAIADVETAEREAQLRVESAQEDVSAARRVLRELRDMDEASDMEISSARSALRKQQQALGEAYLAQETAQEEARRAVEDAELLLEQEKEAADRAAEAAAAETRRGALEREAASVDIGLAQREVEELEALLDAGGIVTAKAGGIVTKVSGGVGSLTSGESLFVLSDASSGVVFRARVSSEELKHIRRGDRAGIVLTGESRAADAVIESAAQTANEDGSFDVAASLSGGNWEPGTGGKMTVTQRTASYSMCVSNGAVRKDQNGHFVLVVRETKGVLGVQTVAERVNISVLERDGNRCAIEGPLDRNDLIIAGGSRPVSAGDRVRVESGI